MYEFTLRKREEDTIKFIIGDNSYQIPLAMGMTPAEAEKMDSTDGAIEFFKSYIDAETAVRLTLRDYRDMINAWKEASQKSAQLGDISLGES